MWSNHGRAREGPRHRRADVHYYLGTKWNGLVVEEELLHSDLALRYGRFPNNKNYCSNLVVFEGKMILVAKVRLGRNAAKKSCLGGADAADRVADGIVVAQVDHANVLIDDIKGCPAKSGENTRGRKEDLSGAGGDDVDLLLVVGLRVDVDGGGSDEKKGRGLGRLRRWQDDTTPQVDGDVAAQGGADTDRGIQGL